MSTLREEAANLAASGSIFTNDKLGERVATYDDVKGIRFGSEYTTADIAMKDFDYREESGDRDDSLSALKAQEDVARINVSAARAYGNPRAPRGMTDGQRVYSMWYRFAETMSRVDASTAKLLNELAYDGWKAGRETGEKLDAEKSGRKSNESAFSDRFLVVAQTEGEARIVRAWMDLAMKYVGDGRTIGDTRPTRFTADRLPPHDEIAALLIATRPGIDAPQKRPDGSVINFSAGFGVIAAEGAEKAAIDFMKASPVAVIPGAGRTLWEGIAKNADLKQKVRMLDGGKKRASNEKINEKIAYEADRLVAFLSGNAEKDAVLMPAIARAFQRGVLTAAFDANGNALSQFALGEEADLLHPSKAVEAHNHEIQRMSGISAASPEGRLLLSLLPKMSRDAIDAIANTGKSVGEILSMARTEDGKGTLYTQLGVGSETLGAMANGNAVTNAGHAFNKILGDCKDAGVVMIAPENYPGALKNDKDAPAVLYVQAKNPAEIGAVQPHLLIAGDQGAPHWMERRSATLASMVHANGNMIAEIEARGQSGLKLETPSILWLATGHGHADVEIQGLVWSRDEQPSARGPVSTWEIVRQPQSGNKDLWKLIETTQDGKSAELPVGNNGKGFWVERKDAAMDEVVRKLKTIASAEEARRAREPVFAARKAIVEAGGFVISAQPPKEKGIAYRYGTQSVSGYPTISTEDSRRQTARLAVKSADALCVTYTSGAETSSSLIGTAVLEGKGMIAVSVPQGREYSPTVERQVKLYTRPGRDISESFPEMSADAKLKLTKRYANETICGQTKDDPRGAAERISTRLSGNAKTKVKAEPKREAERELA